MTIMPQWKICPRCRRRYDWNPDVGVIRCPYCMEKDMKRIKKLGRLFGKENKNNENKNDE